MTKPCPEFEVLSRFADGALEGAEERDLAVHLAKCARCLETLSSIDEVDGLLTLSLPPAKVKRFRLLRPALIPVAAAILFGITIGILLTMPPSNGADTPMAVAEVSPPPAAPAAEPVRDVFCHEQFASPQLSPLLWKTTEVVSASDSLVDASGRRALSLVAQPGGKKRWALVSTSNDYPVSEGVSFDIDYRIPKPQRGGRVQVLVHSGTGKAGRSVLRWSRTGEEEFLEAQESRTKPAILWSSKVAPDSGWHRVKLLVTPREVALQRDGVEAARKPHGLTLDRAGLTLGSTMDRRPREGFDSFECQVDRVVVQREKAQ